MEKFDPLAVPVVSNVVTYINDLLRSTWPVTTMAFQVMFMVDALVVLAVMEHFFPEKRDDPEFPAMMRPIEFLVLTVYGYFMKYQERGYIAPVERYYRMLCEVAGLVPMLNAVDALKREEKIGNLARQLEAVVDLNAPGGTVSTSDAVDHYQTAIDEMVDRIDESRHPRLYNQLLDNRVRLRQTEQALNIRAPRVMLGYVYTFLTLWFGVWFPITLWTNVGVQTTLFLYPSFMYVLWGPTIHRYWLGNPWDDQRVYRESTHTDWPTMFMREIRHGLN